MIPIKDNIQSNFLFNLQLTDDFMDSAFPLNVLSLKSFNILTWNEMDMEC